MKNSAKHIIFRGNVQGVGFRFTSSRIAKRYQLTGYVTNLPGGDVEMLIQGPEEDMEKCLEQIRNSFSGYINDVKIDETDEREDFTSFNITF